MKIIATGRYAPLNSVTNHDLSKIVDADEELITVRTGVKKRRISTGEDTSDFAFKAAQNAIAKARVDLGEIDLIIVATFTPDTFTPSVASIIQEKLGIQNAMTFDLNAACSGFVYGLTVVQHLMLSGKYRYALLIGAETLTKVTNWNDPKTCILFGDGAGAVVLKHSNEQQLLYEHCDAKPDFDHVLKADGLPVVNPFFQGEDRNHYLQMQGKEVFKFAVDAVLESVYKMLEKTQIKLNEVDYFVCHQANIRILQTIATSLEICDSKFYINIDEYGNTSAASIPIALDEMNEKKLLKPEMKIVLIGFGAGLTWGASLIKW